ncbi:MAG: lipoprotein-releasing ABC transporter ATP-binding protein LolD [Agarilytica sp.]
MENTPVLVCENVCKTYAEGPQNVEVLSGVNLRLEKAQSIAIIGASGSGKSTLLNVLGGLDKASAGDVYLRGESFSHLDENARGRLRNKYMGFVYQFHHLLPEFSAEENVAMPLLIAGLGKKEAKRLAQQKLQAVGLDSRLQHKPSELSGGERQRVAIARALANNPSCVLMDEPTGNLDRNNAVAIQNLMNTLRDELETSFIVVTHDEHIARGLDKVFTLQDGVLEESHPA